MAICAYAGSLCFLHTIDVQQVARHTIITSIPSKLTIYCLKYIYIYIVEKEKKQNENYDYDDDDDNMCDVRGETIALLCSSKW